MSSCESGWPRRCFNESEPGILVDVLADPLYTTLEQQGKVWDIDEASVQFIVVLCSPCSPASGLLPKV
jgi:hypothetical protein